MLTKRATAVLAETARFEWGTHIWRSNTEDFLNLGCQNLDC